MSNAGATLPEHCLRGDACPLPTWGRAWHPDNYRLPLPHERSELIEEIVAIVRAGGGFGVVLDAENRKPLVPHALESLVIEIDVAELDVAGKRGRIDREAVVLGGDLDPAGSLVTHRVIGASMAELELEGLAAEGLAQKLVSQADAEDRDTARFGGRPDQGPQGSNRFSVALGSPGPLERKMPSGWYSRIA